MESVFDPVAERISDWAASSSHAMVSGEASPQMTWEYVCVQSSWPVGRSSICRTISGA